MKILFITSGLKGIYTLFEENIIKSLKKLGNICDSFTSIKDLEKLKLKIHVFQPDLILVLVGFKITQPVLQYLKQSKIKSAIWMTEDPYYMDWTIPLSTYFDYIFTIDLAALEQYKKLGHLHVYHLPLGTDPEMFYPTLASEEKFTSDICLVGVPYSNRIELIDFLLKKTDYQIQIVGRGWGRYYKEWEENSKINLNLDLVNAWVKPETVVKYYNGSKIILNLHRPYDEKYNKNSYGIIPKSVNNRTFDAASCEAFQLIDFKDDLSLHFEEGKEIISFENNVEILRKIHYYLVNEKERKHIAKNARKRVLSAHTFQHRMNNMLKKIK